MQERCHESGSCVQKNCASLGVHPTECCTILVQISPFNSALTDKRSVSSLECAVTEKGGGGWVSHKIFPLPARWPPSLALACGVCDNREPIEGNVSGAQTQTKS